MRAVVSMLLVAWSKKACTLSTGGMISHYNTTLFGGLVFFVVGHLFSSLPLGNFLQQLAKHLAERTIFWNECGSKKQASNK